MKSILLVVLPFLLFVTLGHAQVGIGTTTPKAFFNVLYGQTVLFGYDTTGTLSSSSITYPKLIWYGSKGAFRAGGISGSSATFAAWDKDNAGSYSFASGLDTRASGYAATSMGFATTASGYGSVAIGGFLTASGNYALAMGTNTLASGYSSMATGQSSTASGYTSRALGYVATANADFSTAMGNYVSTNSRKGAFIIGDQPPGGVSVIYDIYKNDVDNQMLMRFAGGYKLYSSTPASQTDAVGVSLNAGGNAWQTISDSTRKENFRLTDGTSFLQKISNMRLGSWNYKGQDAKTYRHYGPMAQDFFAAFGQDELGTIGEDKSINQADFDGVNLIAIQALIQKVEKLEAELAASKERESTTQARLAKIESLLTTSSAQTTVTFKP
ncbi:tail fiber domain-containing protein [Spirosoma validum]|uniref:Tail fiber domain-containing protein n=1 Tax=Spirosoma validum TaxID=2771355 RepID=A0A927B7N5_9BACT|nr:tail fiber domain-containing protein [Spirosoma validum]MBD2757220.1 tail fiber domain-containing protein [Spirosoma validum]